MLCSAAKLAWDQMICAEGLISKQKSNKVSSELAGQAKRVFRAQGFCPFPVFLFLLQVMICMLRFGMFRREFKFRENLQIVVSQPGMNGTYHYVRCRSQRFYRLQAAC